MTWFGIAMLVYYTLNIAASFYYIGKGTGPEYTRGSLIFGVVTYVCITLAILFVGTGLGVL